MTGLRITNPSWACISIPSGVTSVTISHHEIGPCGNGSSTDHLELLPGMAHPMRSPARRPAITSREGAAALEVGLVLAELALPQACAGELSSAEVLVSGPSSGGAEAVDGLSGGGTGTAMVWPLRCTIWLTTTKTVAPASSASTTSRASRASTDRCRPWWYHNC